MESSLNATELEDIPKETHYELLKKGESSIRAKAQLIIDTMRKERYYIITDEEKDEYPALVIVEGQRLHSH